MWVGCGLTDHIDEAAQQEEGSAARRPSHQIFPWPSRCGGEEIRLIVRDNELFVNREQVRAYFCKNGEAWFICVRSRSDGYW